MILFTRALLNLEGLDGGLGNAREMIIKFHSHGKKPLRDSFISHEDTIMSIQKRKFRAKAA